MDVPCEAPRQAVARAGLARTASAQLPLGGHQNGHYGLHENKQGKRKRCQQKRHRVESCDDVCRNRAGRVTFPGWRVQTSMSSMTHALFFR